MKAVILAGGLGSRLRSVVSDRPKPMAEASGRPFLEYQVRDLANQGFRELIFCVGYMAEEIRVHFGDGAAWGVRIEYAMEQELLGTAGAVKNAERFLAGAGSFLVVNGDSHVKVDLAAMVRSHAVRASADPDTIGTIVAVRVPNAGDYGTLELGPDGRLIAFREKDRTGPGLVNGGIYVLESRLLEYIPEGQPVSIERETFPLLLERGLGLYGFPVDGFFVDIGTPAGYRRFQSQLIKQGHES